MNDLYNKVAVALWIELERRRYSWDLEYIDWNQPFPADQFAEANPTFLEIVKQIEEKYKYVMSEFQCSWAISQLIRGINFLEDIVMDYYDYVKKEREKV